VVRIIILFYKVIILWDHHRICGPSLTETSLSGAYLYLVNDAKMDRMALESQTGVIRCIPLDIWAPLTNIRGHAVVEALRYKSEGSRFDTRWSHWNFSFTSFFRPHYGLGIDSASNRNENQEYFLGCYGGRCVRLTTLPPSCGACHETWAPEPPGTLTACPSL